ncbi:hypothetical protein C7293_22260 [filamentous cyanobacterium CCT1]|nr:hypothetical protein C7293_22260 [filamentous cyanobacterium CCT1]
MNKAWSVLRLLWGDPRFLVMSWLARFIAVREWVANYGDYQPPATIDTTVIQSTVGACSLDSSGRVAKLIQTHGYYVGFLLQDSTLQDLLTFAETTPCYANRNPALPFYIKNKDQFERELHAPMLLASYLNTHETCEAFQKLKTDPYILDVASQYLNHSAIYLRSELAWAFSTPHTLAEKVSTARVYHCDINDYKTIKFFFYLTEVGEGEGPHIYIKGTHRHRRFSHQWLGQGCSAIDDDTLVELYGRDRVHVVKGPAGLGFAGDPYCLHKGTVPCRQPRLLLQLEYGIYPYRIWYY